MSHFRPSVARRLTLTQSQDLSHLSYLLTPKLLRAQKAAERLLPPSCDFCDLSPLCDLCSFRAQSLSRHFDAHGSGTVDSEEGHDQSRLFLLPRWLSSPDSCIADRNSSPPLESGGGLLNIGCGFCRSVEVASSCRSQRIVASKEATCGVPRSLSPVSHNLTPVKGLRRCCDGANHSGGHSPRTCALVGSLDTHRSLSRCGST